VTRWHQRNDPATIRAAVMKRDGGRCAECGIEAEKIQKARMGIGCPFAFEFDDPTYVGEYLRAQWVAYALGIDIQNGSYNFRGNEFLRGVIEQTYYAEQEIRQQWHEWGLNEADNLPFKYRNASLWEADHIVPVAEGGGGCGPDGYRTLCLRCHRSETAKLAGRLAAKRRAAKEASVPTLDLRPA
jgi:5-methylcytosine-specific restriction endonuclease McrA